MSMKIAAILSLLALAFSACSPNKQRFQLFNTVNVTQMLSKDGITEPKTLMIDTETGQLWEINYFGVGKNYHNELLASPIPTFKTHLGFVEYTADLKNEK